MCSAFFLFSTPMTNTITIPTVSPHPRVYEVHSFSKGSEAIVLTERDGDRQEYVWLPAYGNKAAQFESWKTALSVANACANLRGLYRPSGAFNILEAKSPQTVAYEEMIESIRKYEVK
ncbi:hypothetical protein PP740_gp095 [Stenotrophomonas phage Philippe]|uniref:Uncharacterized protein n=1 Tax=Stenotrophomonas phage Philippe TaxID=2859655 RepID=A0AAE8BII1_9CAUD|nr:hypothetical protein PP740_gp095 [Stenotrophomonas phage Philippe]QYW02247.1 hypothetical protein CPT_Philippe_054 [Stenotrophomonas phage Philippe]